MSLSHNTICLADFCMRKEIFILMRSVGKNYTDKVVVSDYLLWELPDEEEKHNAKSLSIVLRTCGDPETGTPLFTYQHIVDALRYGDRRDVYNLGRRSKLVANSSGIFCNAR